MFGLAKKGLHLPYIATIRLNITRVLKLAHFIRYGSLSMSIHATGASSGFSITRGAGRVKFRNFRGSKHHNAANDSNNDTYKLHNNIRQSADDCETFSFEKALHLHTLP